MNRRNLRVGDVDKPLSEWTVDEFMTAQKRLTSGEHSLLADSPDADLMAVLIEKIKAEGVSTVAGLGPEEVDRSEFSLGLHRADTLDVLSRFAQRPSRDE